MPRRLTPEEEADRDWPAALSPGGILHKHMGWDKVAPPPADVPPTLAPGTIRPVTLQQAGEKLKLVRTINDVTVVVVEAGFAAPTWIVRAIFPFVAGRVAAHYFTFSQTAAAYARHLLDWARADCPADGAEDGVYPHPREYEDCASDPLVR
jgi:hypothetical protein